MKKKTRKFPWIWVFLVKTFAEGYLIFGDFWFLELD